MGKFIVVHTQQAQGQEAAGAIAHQNALNGYLPAIGRAESKEKPGEYEDEDCKPATSIAYNNNNIHFVTTLYIG